MNYGSPVVGKAAWKWCTKRAIIESANQMLLRMESIVIDRHIVYLMLHRLFTVLHSERLVYISQLRL